MRKKCGGSQVPMKPQQSSTASLHSVLYAKPLWTFHSCCSQLEGCHPPSEGMLFQSHPVSSPPVKITQNSQAWHRIREERESSECSQLSQNHSLTSSFESCVTWSNYFFFILFHIFLKWKCEHLGFGCTSFCCTLKTLNATCLAKPPSFKVKKF